MAGLALHWHCRGITYSIRALNSKGDGILYAAGPGRVHRRAHRVLTPPLIRHWRGLSPMRRTVLAERSLAGE